MPIRIKLATSAKELRDVYQLRYQVYAGEGAFQDIQGDSIIDQFDTMPDVANVIAYEGDVPVGTMRVNLDTDILLPPDETYDFSQYRANLIDQAKNKGDSAPILVSAGMLAIATEWRNRRDVFRSIFKLGCDIAYSWGATHIITTVSVKSSTIYRRLGFVAMREKIWYEPAGDHIVPMSGDLALVYQWAFGALASNSEFIDSFSGSFEYLLVSAGTTIFNQDEIGEEAYLISRGSVNITRSDAITGANLSLARLKAGALFGELSLIDDHPRSASALALNNSELIVLSKQAFWQKAQQDTSYIKSLLSILSQRLRNVDERAMLYAHGTVAHRLDFFFNKVKHDAVASKTTPGATMAKITIEEFDHMANAGIQETTKYLEQLSLDGIIKVTDKSILFYDQP
jgi:CRP/FNR family cyclic AMP-dependent transcriptional regulator